MVEALSVPTIMLNENLGDLAGDVLADTLTEGIVVVEDVRCEAAAVACVVALCTLEAAMSCLMISSVSRTHVNMGRTTYNSQEL
jgi:hypothetical protein